jgi:hypothetical protein
LVVHAVESYVIRRDVDRPEAPRTEYAQLAEWGTSRLSVGAFAGRTPKVQQYLRRI